MNFSLNNRLVIEAYKTDRSLQAKVSKGFATIAQKNGLKGLEILMDATLTNGDRIRAGSKAYIREEILHTASWAQNPLECDTLDRPFMIVDVSMVEFICPPIDESAA